MLKVRDQSWKIFLFLLNFFATSLSSELCHGPPTPAGTSVINCIDRYYQYAFCCGWDGENYNTCCYASKVWALWYFWLSIGLFLAVLGGCIGGFLRWRKNKKNGDASSDSSSEADHRAVFVATAEAVPVQQVMLDPPPAYEPQADQALVAQAKELERYEEASADKPSEEIPRS